MSVFRRTWVLLAVVLGLVAAGCSDNGMSDMERTAASIVAAASATTLPTTTVAPPPTTTTARPAVTAPPSTAPVAAGAVVTTPTTPPPGLGTGARGAEVAALEKRLETLLYDVGKVDDVYDQNTAYGVMAFQKVHGMARTGRATDDVIAAVATATQPPALVPNGGENRVEVDIPRQVLFLYKSNTLQKIVTISSGNNPRFCSEGWCRRAVTPGGSYGFYRQGRGWETGPLGSLYNPIYFNGGIAVHGSRSVPAQPASHGCIRIPMSVAEWFPSAVHIGMPVHVVGVDGQPPTPAAPASTPVTQPAAPIITPPPTPTTLGLLDSLLKPTTP
jgi:peptidoglycan hydrolase-like protein with peptidoglycan-binding domain